MSISILINYHYPIKLSFDVETFILKALELKHVHDGSIEFTFIDDDYMKALHKDYLDDPSETDIMTFNLNTMAQPEGDIYICIDEAKRNALSLNIPFETEIKQLILHGILHLIGYTDTNSFDKTYMLDEQNRLSTLIDDN